MINFLCVLLYFRVFLIYEQREAYQVGSVSWARFRHTGQLLNSKPKRPPSRSKSGARKSSKAQSQEAGPSALNQSAVNGHSQEGDQIARQEYLHAPHGRSQDTQHGNVCLWTSGYTESHEVSFSVFSEVYLLWNPIFSCIICPPHFEDSCPHYLLVRNEREALCPFDR